MNNSLTYDQKIMLSHCGNGLQLSLPAAADMFMDLAGYHDYALGSGSEALKKRGMQWIAVKTQIRVFRMPSLYEDVQLKTWPKVSGKLRVERNYSIKNGEELLVSGRTQWIVMDDDKKIRPLSEATPADFVPLDEVQFEGPFPTIHKDFDGCPLLGTHTVTSSDIDFVGHMNNVAYIRALLGLFPVEARKARPVRELTINYNAYCYCGDTLYFYGRQTENGLEIAARLEDGTDVIMAAIGC